MTRDRCLLLLAVCIAIFGVVIVYAPYLADRWSISPYGDTIYLTGPLFCEISRGAKADATPLMNWSTFEALDYNPHVAIYYPLYFWRFLSFCSAVDAAQAADVIAVVHIGIFFITMTRLIKATGAGLPASVIGAALCATLPNTFAMAVFPTFVAVFAWLPLALEGLVRLFYRRGEAFAGALLLAVGTAAMMTAGPGTNLLSALIIFALLTGIDSLVRIVRARDAGSAARIGVALLGAGGLTLLLTLASTLYLYSHLGEFIRWTRSGTIIGTADGGNSLEILAEQLGWRDLAQLLVPTNVSYAAGYFLLGPGAVLLSLAGGWRRWSWPAVRIQLILAVLCVVFVFLSPSGLVQLWTFIPGLSHTRHLSLVATPLCIAIGVLSAHGFEVLTAGLERRSGHRQLYIAAASLVLILSIVLAFSTSLRSVYSAWEIAALGGFAGAVAVVAITAARVGVRSSAVAVLLALQFLLVFGSFPRSAGVPAITLSPTWQSIQTAIEHIRAADPQFGRIALHPSIKDGDLTYLSGGSIATYMNVTTFSHYTSPRLYWKFSHEISLVGENLFAPFGGKYLLSEVDLDPKIGHEVFASGPIRVFKLNGYQSFVDIFCLPSDDILRVAIGEKSSPPGELPQIGGPVSRLLDSLRKGQSDCGASQAPFSPVRSRNSLDSSVVAGPTRIAIINVPPYSAWKMRVEGQEIPLYGLSQRQTIAIIPEYLSGRLELQYVPTTYLRLKRVTLAAWLLAACALMILAAAGPFRRIFVSANKNRTESASAI